MHPEWSEEFEGFVENDCPNEHGILDDPDYCDPYVTCKECWNRQIPGTESEEPHIRDSGSRTEFSTGAVRDIQKGKGRCDLMPLDVVAVLMNDGVVHALSAFKNTGDTLHLEEAVKIFIEARQWNIPTMLLEVSKHFEEGAEKYGENNWQKGLPAKCYINSGVRHYLKWLRGDKDEFHDRAFCWNIICAIWTCKHRPELNDYAPGKLGFDSDDFIGEYEEEND
jgi:hypothetical protein